MWVADHVSIVLLDRADLHRHKLGQAVEGLGALARASWCTIELATILWYSVENPEPTVPMLTADRAQCC